VESDLEFEQLVDSLYESLYRFALSLTRSEADAADLTQDTFFSFATKGNQLRDRSKAKSWLFTTLHRKFLGIKRHTTRFPQVELDAAGSKLPEVAPETVRAMDGRTVLQTLWLVDELYRAPLVLHYLEDHSYREIAAILEVPIGTVMSRISRGKAELRRHLNESAEDEVKLIPFPQRQLSP
jgi:RNA polymerase sigma factor (sigma-70 family)